MFAFLAAILLIAGLSSLCRAAGETVQFNGFVVDYYCWMLPNRLGLDGALLGTNPGAHTTHCMRDIPACVAGGYIILQQKANGAYTYDLKYRFDSTGNDMMLRIVQSTSKSNNLRVTVTGQVMPDDFIAVTHLVLEDSIPNPPTPSASLSSANTRASSQTSSMPASGGDGVSSSSGTGLSAGAIIGIAIGGAISVSVLVGLIVVLLSCRSPRGGKSTLVAISAANSALPEPAANSNGH